MRVAFVGKGGSGKSVIAGTVARLLAQAGDAVLAVDSDPLPGLAYSIGIPSRDEGIPAEAIEERADGEEGPRYRLRAGVDALEAVERYTARGPDGVRMLTFGKLRASAAPLMPAQFAFRQIIQELPPERWSLVGDLPGGTRQPFFGWANFAQIILVVAEPTAKSLLSARRLARLADVHGAPQVVAVANKVRDEDDAERVAARTGLRVYATVPHDPAVADVERRGRPLVDDAPDSPALNAVRSLVERLREETS